MSPQHETGFSPLELPEILIHLNRFLDLPDRIVATQVSRLWRSTFQPFLPSGTLYWKDTLPAQEQAAVLHSLCNNNIHTFECSFQYFKGKALYYMRDREIQTQVWKPFLRVLTGIETPVHEIQLQKLVIRSGMFPEEDYFSILMVIKTLQHLVVDPLPGRDNPPDISRLFKILNVPTLKTTLRQLTVMNGWWPNMGFPFPNKVRSQLAKLVLRQCRGFTDLTMSRLLESCPQLEELVVVDILAQWCPAILKHISKVNPALKSFTFSCAPFHEEDKCGNEQLKNLMDNLDLELTSLGLYRLDCSTDVFLRLQTQFPALSRLEIHGKSSENCGQAVHQYLASAPQLRHLVAKDVFIPMSLLQDESSSVWACKDLRTLEVSFKDGVAAACEGQWNEEETLLGREESKVLFEYLVRHVSHVRRLAIQKDFISLRMEDGIGLLKGLSQLESVSITSKSLVRVQSGLCEGAEMDQDAHLAGLKAQLQSFVIKTESL